jgi:hypothetical protein
MKPRAILLSVLVLCAGLVSACKKDEPKPAAGDTKAPASASAAVVAPVSPVSPPGLDAGHGLAPIPAGTLIKFVPKDGEGGYKHVLAADKEGYAEVKLQKDGKEVAALVILDAERLAFAKAKFEASSEKLEGYPFIEIGKTQSSVLVKGRFQVKVSSPTLDQEARKAILRTVDLKGLGT